MSQNAPAFAPSEEESVSGACTARRWVTGIVCALISLGVLFGVCYILELTKAKLLKEGLSPSTAQAVRKPKANQHKAAKKTSDAKSGNTTDNKR